MVEARLADVVDITGQPNAPCICDENGKVLFDASFRLVFQPIRTVVGLPILDQLPYDQASAQPIVGVKYLLVVAHETAGNVVIWKGASRSGLCLETDQIKLLGLERAARKFPCRD